MHRIHGSSLIESLVALAVFAIGSASTATWMMQSMAIDARASRWVAATTIALSLEARMRVNRDGVIAGDYEWQEPVMRRPQGTQLTRPRKCDSGCNSSEIAEDDLRAFRLALARGVGAAATASVVCDVSAACEIRIAWAGQDALVWSFCL